MTKAANGNGDGADNGDNGQAPANSEQALQADIQRRKSGYQAQVEQRNKEYAQEQLDQLSENHTVSGLRLVTDFGSDDPAIVVTFSEEEGRQFAPLVMKILKARAK